MVVFKHTLPLLALASSAIADDLPSIVIKGSKFFYPNGTQFFFKGVAYQQDIGAAGTTTTSSKPVADPLADEARCKQDIPLLAELNTNIIRTYAIDPTANHDACMKLLNDNNIYVISDLGQPQISIDRSDPQWNTDLYTHYQQVVDSLQKYSNVVGFFAGNEVTNASDTSNASAYVKAAVRDTKAYIKSKKYRSSLGVGYAENDDPSVRDQIASFFNCGSADESIDFLGYNIYEWCAPSNFEESGYNRVLESFQNYSIPVFFAEYGCNKNGGAASRTFQETPNTYVANMTDTLSGGIVYEYFQEANDFGLVKVDGDGAPSKLDDFSALQKQISGVDPKGVSMSSYNPTNKAAACPAVNANWASSDKLPPTPDAVACGCMANASTCGPAANLATTKYKAIFDYVCNATTVCSVINGDTAKGVYGAYSMCSDEDKLNIILGAYYKSQNNVASACDFKGQAATKSATGNGKCTPTGSTGSSGSGSSGKPDKSFAVHAAPHMHMSLGGFGVGVCSLIALFTAGAMAL